MLIEEWLLEDVKYRIKIKGWMFIRIDMINRIREEYQKIIRWLFNGRFINRRRLINLKCRKEAITS